MLKIRFADSFFKKITGIYCCRVSVLYSQENEGNSEYVHNLCQNI